MSSKIDLLNKQFGRLKVIESLPSKRNKRNISITFWKCICACGNTLEVRAVYLLTGETQSCGCLRKECAKEQGFLNYKGDKIAAINKVFYHYKKRAKIKNIEFKLTLEEFQSFLFKDCYYCGISPSNSHKRPEVQYTMIYNGLDRTDSTKGYEMENIVSCCKRCNTCKSDMSIEEFFLKIKKIYERHINE